MPAAPLTGRFAPPEQGGVVGLTCRVGRAIPGSAAMLADLAASGRSILLLGRPGVGKTTAIRDLARLLASEAGGRRRVVVVDTSNEVGGDGDVPHTGLGAARRMQVRCMAWRGGSSLRGCTWQLRMSVWCCALNALARGLPLPLALGAQVVVADEQHRVMIEAVENHMPGGLLC